MKKITFIIVLIFSSIFVNAQDIIYKNDGTEIKVKIIELTTETVKYKNFEQLQGPIRNILLSDVFMIIYQDGTREIIKSKKADETPPPTVLSTEQKVSEPEPNPVESHKETVSLNSAPKVNSFNREKYVSGGFSAKSFVDSELKDYFGEFLGLELESGIEVVKDLSASLYTSTHWKKLEDDEKFRYWDIAFQMDYRPADFNIGAGFLLGSLTTSYYDTSNPSFPQWKDYSDYALGFVFRIGYEIEFSSNFGMYGSFRYTILTLEDGDEKLEIANFGASIGIIFN